MISGGAGAFLSSTPVRFKISQFKISTIPETPFTFLKIELLSPKSKASSAG